MSRKDGPAPTLVAAVTDIEDACKAVNEAWINAHENGVSFAGMSADEIADDMMTCDVGIEQMPRCKVLLAVKAKMQENIG